MGNWKKNHADTKCFQIKGSKNINDNNNNLYNVTGHTPTADSTNFPLVFVSSLVVAISFDPTAVIERIGSNHLIKVKFREICIVIPAKKGKLLLLESKTIQQFIQHSPFEQIPIYLTAHGN